LKEKGYKTFDNFIDESYDNIKDPNQRMQQIFNTVNKINQKPLNELMAHVKDSAEKFFHNSTLMMNTIGKYKTHYESQEEVKNAS
jgi:hypothetical protein